VKDSNHVRHKGILEELLSSLENYRFANMTKRDSCQSISTPAKKSTPARSSEEINTVYAYVLAAVLCHFV